MSEAGFLDNCPALTPDGLFDVEDCPSYRVLDTGVRVEDGNVGCSFRAGEFRANLRWGKYRDDQNGMRLLVDGGEVTLHCLTDEGETESLVGELINFEEYDGKTTVTFQSANDVYEVIANSATVHLIKILGQ